ncbi:FYVE/PHD zinc finger [Glarea lozoyensis ATCC 20868]|uniref:FYVE/PHD zinc finger n=1 Tax=Glarea lozoyensis (strain ATCC 20868 / MF5171) TaxID=1116229 RepID=S3DIG4_GLAL2|nr:FYVE/PHD zinc finger [Glarea lozoyensis ATCC 20868]EPE36949.1 FYVE/PHD zinc finger [Glarea lozoyensis ATCC 20868]
MDTARRSSRAARSSQPAPSNSHHSSASSNSSGRAERATRSHQKTESPRKSTPTGSLSSEPLEEAVATPVEDAIQTRRKRGRAEDKDKPTKAQAIEIETTNGNDEGAEDDEAVRCICGFDEYPGPPQLGDEDSKNGIKDGIEEPIISVADITEDGAGFFLQCDVCKVWQHGYCVGIMNEDMSPEEYFCEECRKDLHRIFAAPNGQRYSHYLPLYQSLSRTTSRAASFSKDGTRSPRGSKSGRPSSSLQSAKRRSTMNSRDAAYDEEEQLRRAIEASKGEKSGESTDGGTIRRGKRGRSDSEEKQEGPKRQRTQSASPSPPQEQNDTPQADSDDGTNGRVPGPKKIRGAAARNHREKEMREEKEKIRQEAASKRKGRAERRRLDGELVSQHYDETCTYNGELDSDPSEEIPLASRISTTKAVVETPIQPLDPPQPFNPAIPDTPPAVQPPVSHKKGGRPPNSRKGKLGKNQYTKDRDLQEGSNPSPQRSQSRDVPRAEESSNGIMTKSSHHEGKASKSKIPGSKISMADARKRVGSILDYISRTQLEMAGESVSPITTDSAEKTIRGVADGLPMIKVNGKSGTEDGAEEASKKEFEDLSCVEMMDNLTRQLVKWQKEHS